MNSPLLWLEIKGENSQPSTRVLNLVKETIWSEDPQISPDDLASFLRKYLGGYYLEGESIPEMDFEAMPAMPLK